VIIVEKVKANIGVLKKGTKEKNVWGAQRNEVKALS